MNGAFVADAKGFVYEPVRGPKRKGEFEPRWNGGSERTATVWTDVSDA